MDELRKASVEATGVVKFEYDGITVNARDIVSDIRAMIDQIPIAKDYNGAFAARVKLEVELLGDMEKEAKKD